MAKKAANDNFYWTLDVKTHTRDQLIDLSSFLAKAMKPDFFHNPNKIPYIIVPGDGGGGKCMVVEAMMKTLLDQYDPEDMKRPGAPTEMFIEREPMDAWHRYCSAFGSTDGIPVMYGFDRCTYGWGDGFQKRLIESFQEAAQCQKSDGPWPVGGIFVSGRDIGHSKPWIVIHLSYDDRRKWDRDIRIDVREKTLKSCPQFREYWEQLHVFKETGHLIEPITYKEVSKKDLALLLSTLENNKVDLETSLEFALLATLFSNRKALGISSAELVEIVKQARHNDANQKAPAPALGM